LLISCHIANNVSAQALYSLTQDNPPFRNAVLSNPSALQVLLQVCQADHAGPEGSAGGRVKGKGKAKNASSDAQSELSDGRALLCRVLIAGEFDLFMTRESRG